MGLVKKMGAGVLTGITALTFLVGCETTKGSLLGGILGAGAGAAIDKDQRGRGAIVGGLGGAIIGSETQKYIETKKYCPSCGERYKESFNVCPKDGTELRYNQ